MMAMAWEQSELFPKANEAEIERTKFLLGKYKEMKMLMEDFEQHERALQQVAIDGEVARRLDADDLHADKAANAVILMEKQRWVYEQYKMYTTAISRAVNLIQDDEAQRAIYKRYIEGRSFKETSLYFCSILSESTVRRKLVDGIGSISNTLKLSGFFDIF